MRLLAALAIGHSLSLPGLTWIDVLLALATFLCAILAEGISACVDRNENRIWIAIGLAAAAATYLAWLHVIMFGSGKGMFIVLGVAIVLWFAREAASRHPRLGTLVRPFGKTAFVLPLVAVGFGVYRHLTYAHPEWKGLNSLALLLAGGFYFWRGIEDRRKELVLLSAAVLNVALLLLWRELRWSDPQFYMVPIGITVLALVQLLKAEIPHRFHDPFRYAGALVILVSPVYHIAHGSWIHLITLMIASVGIALLAIGLRVRALVYTGTAFLLADLAAMVVRGSMDDANVLWIAGLAMGTAVLMLGAACERNREAVLQRMRVLAEALKRWE